MVRVCQFCHEVYGEKEPLEDKRETHGDCELCHDLWTIWYALWQEGQIKESASEFIFECRKVLGFRPGGDSTPEGETRKESVIQNYLEAR